MRRVDDDRQVTGLLHIGHHRQVEHVAGGIFEAADPSLTQDHLFVALGQDVLGRHQQITNGGTHAPLEHHRTRGLPDLTEQVEVLHVSCADLKHVGVTVDQFHLPGIHHLGNHRHSQFAANVLQDLQSLLAHPLETVGAGPWLERSASQDVRSGLADRLADLHQHLSAFDCARTGNHPQRSATDTDPPTDIDDRVLGLEITTGPLVRLENRHHLLDAGKRAQRGVSQHILLADHSDQRPLHAATQFRFQSQGDDLLLDVLDLFIGAVRFKNNDHGRSFSSKRPVRSKNRFPGLGQWVAETRGPQPSGSLRG